MNKKLIDFENSNFKNYKYPVLFQLTKYSTQYMQDISIYKYAKFQVKYNYDLVHLFSSIYKIF